VTVQVAWETPTGECQECGGKYAHLQTCSKHVVRLVSRRAVHEVGETPVSPEEHFASIVHGRDPGDEQNERPNGADVLGMNTPCPCRDADRCRVDEGLPVGARFCRKAADSGPRPAPTDLVNHPPHYKTASGLEAIEVIEAFAGDNYNRGAALKYLLRAGRKGDKATDLHKAAWHIERELSH